MTKVKQQEIPQIVVYTRKPTRILLNILEHFI